MNKTRMTGDLLDDSLAANFVRRRLPRFRMAEQRSWPFWPHVWGTVDAAWTLSITRSLTDHGLRLKDRGVLEITL